MVKMKSKCDSMMRALPQWVKVMMSLILAHLSIFPALYPLALSKMKLGFI